MGFSEREAHPLGCGQGVCVHGDCFSPTGSAAILPLQSPTALWENHSGWGQREVTSAAHPWGSCLTHHITPHRAAWGYLCSTLLITLCSSASPRLCCSSRNCRRCSQVLSQGWLIQMGCALCNSVSWAYLNMPAEALSQTLQ